MQVSKHAVVLERHGNDLLCKVSRDSRIQDGPDGGPAHEKAAWQGVQVQDALPAIFQLGRGSRCEGCRGSLRRPGDLEPCWTSPGHTPLCCEAAGGGVPIVQAWQTPAHQASAAVAAPQSPTPAAIGIDLGCIQIRGS